MTAAVLTTRFNRIDANVRWAVVIGALAMLGFAIAFWMLGELVRHGFYGPLTISDVPVYADYGDRMYRGLVPYRDWPLEYPPASIPFFLIPAIAANGSSTANPTTTATTAVTIPSRRPWRRQTYATRNGRISAG
jgi:hypothetical protein